MLSFDVAFYVLWHFNVRQEIGEAEKCLVGCRVTKAEFSLRVLVLSSTNHLGALDGQKRVDMLVLEHYVLVTELWVHVSRLLMPHLDRD